MKHIVLLLSLLLLYSCDPGYTILISNRTDHDKYIKLKQNVSIIEFRENKKDSLEIGNQIKIDSITPFQFDTVQIPKNQTIKIYGTGFAIPHGECIIVDGDTISEFTPIKSSLFLIKYRYFIR